MSAAMMKLFILIVLLLQLGSPMIVQRHNFSPVQSIRFKRQWGLGYNYGGGWGTGYFNEFGYKNGLNIGAPGADVVRF
ncbi:unnamed protein product [Toxocara canis]|nr:unnamed protein product [Toxocara canis]